MAITYTWAATGLKRRVEDNFVIKVNWEVTAEESGFSAVRDGVALLKGEEAVIPYEDLTEAQCIQWAQESMGLEILEDNEEMTLEQTTAIAISDVESSLARELQEKVTPSTADGTPWG